MFLLRQLLKLRPPTAHDGAEMTLLDHLEEFRRTLLAMLACLLVAMVLCFSFTPQVMAVLTRPVQDLRLGYESTLLPDGVDAADWRTARRAAQARPMLAAADRAALDAALTLRQRELADAVPLLAAARALPEQAAERYLAARHAAPVVQELYRSGASTAPVEPAPGSSDLMGAFQPGEAFMLSLSLSFFCGLIVSFPVMMYFLLRFVVPGLLEHERRLVYKSLCWGFLLFLAGCAFAYFLVLPRVLSFFFNYSQEMGISNDWRIGYYLTFTAKLILVFGVIFELPVIVIPLIKLGLLTYGFMKRTRAYALVGCLSVALVLAPAPDPGTMLIMALPMYLLYEICILFARRAEHQRQQPCQSGDRVVE